jgi:hypothetical protein
MGKERKTEGKNQQISSNVSSLMLAKRMDIRSLQANHKNVYASKLDQYNASCWIKGAPPNTTEFVNLEEKVTISSQWQPSLAFDVSQFITYTMAVLNSSDHEVEVELQISPDKVHYVTEEYKYLISPHKINVIIPQRFLRFVRLLLRVKGKNHEAEVKIFLQAQK